MARRKQVKKIAGKPVRITRKNPDNLRLALVNDFVVNHNRDGFFLTFSLLEPPQVLDEKDLEELQGVEAIAKAKLFVTPRFAEVILKVLATNIETYNKSAEELEDDTA